MAVFDGSAGNDQDRFEQFPVDASEWAFNHGLLGHSVHFVRQIP